MLKLLIMVRLATMTMVVMMIMMVMMMAMLMMTILTTLLTILGLARIGLIGMMVITEYDHDDRRIIKLMTTTTITWHKGCSPFLASCRGNPSWRRSAR